MCVLSLKHILCIKDKRPICPTNSTFGQNNSMFQIILCNFQGHLEYKSQRSSKALKSSPSSTQAFQFPAPCPYRNCNCSYIRHSRLPYFCHNCTLHRQSISFKFQCLLFSNATDFVFSTKIFIIMYILE